MFTVSQGHVTIDLIEIVMFCKHLLFFHHLDSVYEQSFATVKMMKYLLELIENNNVHSTTSCTISRFKSVTLYLRATSI